MTQYIDPVINRAKGNKQNMDVRAGCVKAMEMLCASAGCTEGQN
jgi:hypothetical protein